MARTPSTRKRRPSRRTNVLQEFRTNFLTGLVIVVPVAMTIWLVWTFINFVDARVLPLVPGFWNPETYGWDITGFGVIIFVLFTGFVGAFAKGIFGRQLVGLGESVFDRVPIIRTIYNGVKQITETVLNQSNTSFQKACLIEYPRRGLWAVAFISTDATNEVTSKAGEPEMTSVFLPTTPNPTSGFLLFVPKRDVVELDMSIEDAAKLVISAGLVAPDKPTPVTTTPPRKVAAGT
ncbi:MAG: DUF502 domain-containing protein [Pseudomonadota bacterium]